MRLEMFFEKFDQLADAPNALAKMRELVLQLALNGSVIGLDSEKWERVPLGTLGDWGSGGTPFRGEPQYYGGSIPWLVIGDLNDGVVTSASTFITEEGLANSSARILPEGVLLIAMYGSIGKLGITGIECATNQAIAFCKPDPKRADLRYLFHTIKGIQPALLARGQGLAQKNISQTILKAWEITLPPLAEQKRIVAKVDELMAFCDRLEAQQQERDTRHAALARASLARFAEAPTPANLDFLFHDSYTITPADLRKTILTLAVQGKLVPQEARDGSAKNEIEIVRQQGFAPDKKSGTKDSIPSLPTEPLEVPWVVPDSWCWVDLCSACHTITDGEHLTPTYSPDGVPMLSAKHIGTRKLIWDDYRHVSETVAEKCWSRCKPDIGDILVVSRGGGVGRTIISDRNAYCLMGSVLLFKTRPNVSSAYLNLYLNSDYGNEKLRTTSGSSAQQAIYITHLRRDYILPMPPLAEQHRIVAKVDQLMALVDQLETQLTASRATVEKLMEAVVAELVKVETSKSPRVSNDKPAQSNLTSIASRRSTKKKVSDEFVEAIVIAQLTRDLATSKFPLGRMRYNKLAYLAHRKAEDDMMHRYLKKAAGPYSPWAKYGGPEKIALENGYVKKTRSGKYEGWIPGEHIGDIDRYLPNYPVCSAVSWVLDKLQYKKNEELELLATVDFAALDLRARDSDVTRETVRSVIATNEEWAPKLNRDIFSDGNIEKALAELSGLFPSIYSHAPSLAVPDGD